MSLFAFTGALGAALVAPQNSALTGIWYNSKDSVAVDVTACGKGICGRVVRASGRAEEGARKAGAPRMIGTQVLRNFVPTAPNSWRGTIFVPDRNRTFTAFMTRNDSRHVKIQGCILGGLICRSEVWHRPPDHT
jgi:uncharacterized protein (DUF2147 family)